MENLEKLKAQYETLRKKFDLPNLEYLNSEFEINAIDVDKSGIFIRAILRMIIGKIALFLNYLDPVVSPNPQSYHSMVELNNLSNEDKQGMLDYYKRLSTLYHEGCAVELKSEKEIADYIKRICINWAELKKEAIKFLDKITEAWTVEKKSEKTVYTG